MVNQEWRDSFPNVVAHFIPEGQFDHCLVIIGLYPAVDIGKHLFKYSKMWSSAPYLLSIISTCLNEQVQGALMYRVMSKMKMVKKALKKLNVDGFSKIQSKDLQAYKKMIMSQEAMQADPTYLTLRNTEQESVADYIVVHKAYLSFLSQKAKLQWCEDRDENSSLFYQSIKARRLKNTNYAINDKDGIWQENLTDVNEAFLSYYKQLLGSTLSNRAKVNQAMISMGPVLNSGHVELLERPYTTLEVTKALFSIPGDKSPARP